MNLYNRKSIISVAPDGKPQPSGKSGITQLLYFCIVIFLVGYLLYLLFKPYFMVEANGLVYVEQRDIVAVRSGILEAIYVEVNQDVSEGTLLARLAPEKQCLPSDDTQLEKLAFDMNVLQNDILALRKERNHFASLNASSAGMQRALEINASLFKAQLKEQQDAQKRVQQIDIDIQRANGKMAIMSARRDQMLLELKAEPIAEDCVAKNIIAFEDGRIADIRAMSQTYADKGGVILKYVPSDAKAKVVLLADAKLYSSFLEQPQWVIVLPNGEESTARVDTIESVASRVSGDLNTLLSQEKISLRMVLVPDDPAHNALWRQFDRLPVSVRGVR